jgi:hypothetical protein
VRRGAGSLRRLGTLGVAVALAASACARGEGARPAAAVVTQEQARFGSTLWQTRGHHLVSLALYEAGRLDEALPHASHPLDEVLPAVEGTVRDRSPDAADFLRTALQEAAAAVRDGRPAPDVRAAFDRAVAALREAEGAAVGEAAKAPAYVGSVVAGLLAAAAHEYEEAAPEGGVADAEEYRDAYGFFLAARERYAELAAGIRETAAHEAEEIDQALAQLAAAFPGLDPPTAVAAPEDVERAAALVGHELEETVGAVVAALVEAEEVWEAIEVLLDRALAAYRSGEAEEAAELIAQAYLENYELVEGEVIEHAPELNDELEPLLSAGLRAQVRDGVPVEDLARAIERAKALLARARQAVAEAGP